MKTLQFLFMLTLLAGQNVLSQCNSGSLTVTTNTVITGSCIVTGDLVILNDAVLNVDLTGAGADTFIVRGNILLRGNAVLWIHAAPGSAGDQFIVSNNHSSQRSITTKDSSRLQLEYVEFRTQEGNLANAASVYMSYSAENNSILYVNKTWIDTRKSWLLCNMKHKSTFIGYEPNNVPTETYLQDTAHVALYGPNTNAGIWLNFESITDTLNLPPDQTQPFSWKIGRGAGGLNTHWYLEVETARVGFGVQVFPSAQLTINGSGFPAYGELKVALLFANNTDTIKDLKVGLQNTTVSNGPNGKVILNNVNLGPIAWQLYALMNEDLYIKNSIVNEIGIAGPSNVTVDSCLLQLAVLASIGIGGSNMTINNSEIWNQSITATNNSRIVLNNCKVSGSAFSTTDGLSQITVNGGCFFKNPLGCTENSMVNIATGQPYCNPFIPPGFPQNLTPGSVFFNGVNSNCTTGLIRDLLIFPNPSNNLVNIHPPNPGQHYTIEVCSIIGQEILKTSDKTVLDLSNLPTGIYIIRVKQGGEIYATKMVKQ